MIDIIKINKIAIQSRRWAMRNRNKFNCDKSLAGMCGIASAYLHKSLTRNEIRSVIAVNDEHVFIVIDEYIIDITATQFGKKSICIVEIDKVNDYFWNICNKFSSVDDLREYQKNELWPIDQIV